MTFANKMRKKSSSIYYLGPQNLLNMSRFLLRDVQGWLRFKCDIGMILILREFNLKMQ